MNLAALAAALPLWLTAHGVPTPPTPIAVGRVPAEYAATYQGFGSDPPLITLSADWTLNDVLHELAHSSSARSGHTYAGGPEELAMEEGAAQAIADDLEPAARHAFGDAHGGPPGLIIIEGPVYVPQVQWLRRVSGWACRTRWTSRCARYWRRAFLVGDRWAMLTAADAPPPPVIRGG